MSVLSQFMGGDGTEIGQVIPTTGAMNYFVSGSKEYLRTGFLRSYSASYSALKDRAPYACWVDLSVTNASPAFGSLTIGSNARIWHDGTRYWLIRADGSASTNQAYTSTDLSAWTSGLAGSVRVLDSTRVGTGTNIVAVGGDGTGTSAFSSQGTGLLTGVSTPFSNQLISVASNTTGNLIVAITSQNSNDGSANILTSTTGNAWTSRIGTGGNNFVMQAVTWSPCSSAFFIIGGSTVSISMNKTTDGFTQTAVWNADTTAGGIDSSFFASSEMFIAHSPTATIISQTGGRLRRTTDGTTWSVIDLNTVNGASLLSQGGTPGAYKIFYDSVNSRFICFTEATGNGIQGTYTLHSTDNGATWFPYFGYRLTGTPKPYIICSANNQTLVLNYTTTGPASNISNATNDIAQANPDWIGSISVVYGSGSTVATHMRIL
jgi:hypothetical protein